MPTATKTSPHQPQLTEIVTPPGCDTGANPIATHPDFPTLRAEWIAVTPELAAKWLELNINNRPKRDNRIQALMDDLQEGNWVANGASIVFGLDGELYDGQHRLESVARGETVPAITLVVWGVDEVARKVIDNGAARKVADFLTMSGGVANATAAASVARRWYVWHTYPEQRYMVHRKKPQHTPIIDTYNEHSEWINRAVKYANWARGKNQDIGVTRTVTVTVWAFCYMLFEEACDDQTTVEWFLDRVAKGDELKAGDPERALRRYLSGISSDRRTKTLREDLALYLFISAWSAFRSQRKIDRLSLPKNQITKENWPDVV